MAFLERFFKKVTDSTEATISNQNSLSNHLETDIASVAEQMLMEVKVDLSTRNSVKLSIAQITSLGAGVSSLLPSLRTITQTASTSGTGLYRLINAGLGDVLKISKDGSLWGAMKTAGGASKMAKFVNAGPLTSTTTAVAAINPATLMMAVALASIEKRLDEVIEIGKQIISFLEKDKESKIEGDLKTLTGIIQEYKFNWDNTAYISSHHTLVLGIKRSAEQNIIFYQKQIAGEIGDNPLLHFDQFTSSVQDGLSKHFRYYRMSLYTYAFASFLEVMLLGNFRTEYIKQVQGNIDVYASEYRGLFDECSSVLSKIAGGSVESQVLKGLGAAVKAAGTFIGNIPIIKDGSADEWLIDGGTQLDKNSDETTRKTITAFSENQNSGCEMFLDNLRQVERLYNKTTDIYFDKDNVYLLESNE